MGYTRGSNWTALDVVGSMQNQITADTSATDTSLSTISIPDYTGVLTGAYLVLTVQQVRNTDAVNQNGIAGWQKIQIRDTSLTYQDAIDIKVGSFYCNPSQVISGTFEIVGSDDLKSYISPNGVYLLRWEDMETYFDSLWFYGTQMKMKLYFGG